MTELYASKRLLHILIRVCDYSASARVLIHVILRGEHSFIPQERNIVMCDAPNNPLDIRQLKFQLDKTILLAKD